MSFWQNYWQTVSDPDVAKWKRGGNIVGILLGAVVILVGWGSFPMTAAGACFVAFGVLRLVRDRLIRGYVSRQNEHDDHAPGPQ